VVFSLVEGTCGSGTLPVLFTWRCSPTESGAPRKSRIKNGSKRQQAARRGSAEELALLGTLPDEEVAAKIGKMPSAVRQKRKEMGIANPAANCWAAEEIALLGKLPDEAVAARIGRSRTPVTQKRCQLGIANRCDRRRRRRSS
jgi:hypothetical protein